MKQYACDPAKSRGRHFQEEFRFNEADAFTEDRLRLISAAAFRRMEYKTQVFANHAGDHYRNRLTHSIEVSNVARLIASRLQINQDLAEVIALAHDIGHSPFGHVGEDALNEKMLNFGGFSHNCNSFKIVTNLEKTFHGFDGLNLTWESLEGIVKHNGPIAKNSLNSDSYILKYDRKCDLDLENYSSLEAQAAAVADDISYVAHDIEDGIRAGFFKIEEFNHIKLMQNLSLHLNDNSKEPMTNKRFTNEFRRHMINLLVDDVCANSLKNLEKQQICSVQDVRNAGETLVFFSDEIFEDVKKIKSFLFSQMYNSPEIRQERELHQKIVKNLFDYFIKNPSEMTEIWVENANDCENEKDRAILICDYIAGMTDRYAIKIHEQKCLKS